MRGYMLAAVSSASYGVNAFAPILYAKGFNIDSVLIYRYLFALIMIGAIALYRRIDMRLTRKELCLVAPVGVAFALSSLTLFESYNHVGVSLAATVLFVYPAMVALLLWAFFKEKPNAVTIAAIPVVMLGIFLLDVNGIIEGESSWVGLLIVCTSALMYAIYMVIVQKSALSKMNALKLSFYSLLFGGLLFVARLPFTGGLRPLSDASEWVLCVALAFFPSLLSLSTMAMAIRLIGSTSTAVLGAFEPLTSVLIGVALYGERPDVWAWVGMSIIVLSVTVMVTQAKIAKVAKKVSNNIRKNSTMLSA